MKKIILLFVLFSCIGYAQENSFDGKTLSLKDGGSITIDEDLKIGKGTKDNGSFRYIEVNSGSMMRSYVQDADAMSSSYNDLKAKIIRIEERGNKRSGKKWYAVIGVGGTRRYQVDIENALVAGEIIVEGSFLGKNNGGVSENNSYLKADELIKIKSLKDEGIITEEEFNKLKAEILSK